MEEGIKKGISDEELMYFINNKGTWITYDQLYKNFKKGMKLDDMMKYGILVVLFMSADDYGHWTVVIDHRYDKENPRNIIGFYDSYGIYNDDKTGEHYFAKPDSEFRWIPDHLKIKYHQIYPTLSALMLELAHRNHLKIEFNEFPFQKDDGETATCGRWSSMFVNYRDVPLKSIQKIFSKIDPDKRDMIVYKMYH